MQQETTQDRNATPELKDTRGLALAFFVKLKEIVNKQLPTGCQLDESRCKKWLKVQLEEQGLNADIPSAFMTEIQRHPRDFIRGIDEFFEKQARELYSQFEKSFCEALPKGVTPKRDQCIAALKQLIEENTSPEQLLDCFVQIIKKNPLRYLTAPEGHAHVFADISSSAPVASSVDQSMMSSTSRLDPRLDHDELSITTPWRHK